MNPKALPIAPPIAKIDVVRVRFLYYFLGAKPIIGYLSIRII